MPTPDSVLLRRWTDDADAAAFAELVQRHATMVHSACRRIVGDHALADDLAQECFLRLADGERAPERNLAGWLHRVATNRALSARRTRHQPVGVVDIAFDGRTPDRLAEARELTARVDAAIAALPDAQRDAVVGHFLEGRSHRELARSLGVSRRTVGYRVERGVDAVRDALRRGGLHFDRMALAGWLDALPRDPMLHPLIAGSGATATGAALAVAGSVKAGLAGLAAIAVLAITTVWLASRPAAAPAGPGERAAPTPRVVVAPGGEGAVVGDSERVALDPADAVGPAPRTATLSGSVQTPDGLPVAGASVVLVETAATDRGVFAAQPGLDPTRAARATADDRGRFTLLRRDRACRAVACAFADGLAGQRAWVAADSDAEVVLVLHPGRTLRGRVSDLDGAPLADASVAVEQCWSAADHAEFGSGFALTDARGEFAIGVDADAVGCTLQVECRELGSDVFVGVPTDVFAELRWNARATVRGLVAGMTGERVGRIRVDVIGSLDDPPVPVFRTGFRPQRRFPADVAADGSYAVTGIQPGLSYRAQLVETDADGADRNLSPDVLDRFGLAPAEIVERNFQLAAPIVVTGRVVTAGTRRPVQGARLEVTADGATLWDAFVQTDAEGRYELEITGGTGTYRLRALPRSWIGSAPADVDSSAERRFAAGDRSELDLVLPEPTEISFRVVDGRGAAVDSVRTELRLTTVDGRHAQVGDSQRLDADGRGRIEVFDSISAARLTVSRFPAGPRSEVLLTELSGHRAVPEQTLVLRDACTVTGAVLDRDGNPLGGATLRVTARYDDGGQDWTSTRTDRDGRFTLESAFRAAGADLELTMDDGRRAAARVSATAAGEVADIGRVLVD